MKELTTRLLDILRFWHKLEFFVPFDLDSRIRDKDGRKYLHRLRDDQSPVTFSELPKGKVVSGYTLFLGVFDVVDVEDVVREHQPSSEWDRIDEQQRAKLEGRTCIASIRLDKSARPLFESVEVSSLPWAVGKVRSEGLDALSSGAFQAARKQLAMQIVNFATRRAAESEDGVTQPLQHAEIGTLTKLFCNWANVYPEHNHPEAVLEVLLRDAPKEPKKGDSDSAAQQDDADEEDSEEEDDAQDVGILNSFYLEDIEMAIRDCASGNCTDVLAQYLTPLAPEDRCDLYSDQGRELITDMLSPQRMNRGRWLSNPDHAMSLMQQFAINTTMENLADGGLYSVNGPPGTGKTTGQSHE